MWMMDDLSHVHPVNAGLIQILRLVEREANLRTKERALLALSSIPLDKVEEGVVDVATMVLDEMRGEIERMFKIRRLLAEEDEG
jgi:hypothetical protein